MDDEQDNKQSIPVQDDQPMNTTGTSSDTDKDDEPIDVAAGEGYDQEPPTDPDNVDVDTPNITPEEQPNSTNEPNTFSEGDSPFGPPIENIGSMPNPKSGKAMDVIQPPEEIEPVNNEPSGTELPTDSDMEIETKNEASSALLQATPLEEPAEQQQQTDVVPEPTEKKRFKGLVIGAIAFVLLAGAAAVGYVMVKSNADTVASDYVTSANAYIDSVYTLASPQPIENPAELRSQIAAIDRPVLENAFLSGISSSYTEANKMQEDVNVAIGAVILKLEELESYIELQEFVADYLEATQEGEAILAGLGENSTAVQKTEAYTEYIANLEALKESVDAVTLPAELSTERLALSGAIEEEIAIYESRITALGATSTNTTTPATTSEDEDLNDIRTTREEAFSAIEDYSDGINPAAQATASEVLEAAETLRALKREE